MTKNSDTFKEFYFILVESIKTIQYDNDGPWTHGTVISHGDHDHKDRLDKVQLTKLAI